MMTSALIPYTKGIWMPASASGTARTAAPSEVAAIASARRTSAERRGRANAWMTRTIAVA